MNHRNDFRQKRAQLKRPPSRRARRPHDEPRSSDTTDAYITGFEDQYLSSLMETGNPIVVVLQQGEQIAGRIAWYDQGCLKITPPDGSPSLLVPKLSIRYLYEAIAQQNNPSPESQPEKTTID